jgi:hypothetical protein
MEGMAIFAKTTRHVQYAGLPYHSAIGTAVVPQTIIFLLTCESPGNREQNDIIRRTKPAGWAENGSSETLAVHSTNGSPIKPLSQLIEYSLLSSGCRYEATRVRHMARRCLGCVVAPGVRAALVDSAGWHPIAAFSVGRCLSSFCDFSPNTSRPRLCRGSIHQP